MKYIFFLLVLVPMVSLSQISIEKQLDSVTSSETALKFLKTNNPEEGKIVTFNKEKHKTKLTNSLFSLSIGGKKVEKTGFKKTFYKILDKSEVDFNRFNIIVLDGNKTSSHSAKTIRDKILLQYQEGYQFIDLAKQHSDDSTANKGGDTGWIKRGDISDAFDEIAFDQNHIINEVFTIDDVENNKYYIALKTKSKTPIQEITVLKFTEDIE